MLCAGEGGRNSLIGMHMRVVVIMMGMIVLMLMAVQMHMRSCVMIGRLMIDFVSVPERDDVGRRKGANQKNSSDESHHTAK